MTEPKEIEKLIYKFIFDSMAVGRDKYDIGHELACTIIKVLETEGERMQKGYCQRFVQLMFDIEEHEK